MKLTSLHPLQVGAEFLKKSLVEYKANDPDFYVIYQVCDPCWLPCTAALVVRVAPSPSATVLVCHPPHSTLETRLSRSGRSPIMWWGSSLRMGEGYMLRVQSAHSLPIPNTLLLSARCRWAT